MKRFEPIMCPVCGKMYFSEPLEDFKEEELNDYLNGAVQCRHCGWIYDLDQAEKPDLKEGFNELSVNEFKKEFEQKIKDNPEYDYFEENMPDPEPHMCPVCGEYKFPDEGSFDVCEVCGWEDDGYYEEGGANGISLEDAIAEFKKKRAENPKYKWINEQK